VPTAAAEKPSPPSVLLIVTGHAKLGTTEQTTGFWLEELAAPFYVFQEAGWTISIGSPAGGKPPVDPKSLAEPQPEVVKRFLAEKGAVARLEHSVPLQKLGAKKFDAYFVCGGHGVMWDLGALEPAAHGVLPKLLASEYEAGKCVAAVCHGPAALVPVRLSNGDSIVKGLRVTGFSNEEEEAVKLSGVVPYALESKLGELGGKYERGANWASFAVRDGRLVTGQNPASSTETARLVLAVVADSKKQSK
jgi:putative intracellular protease/amidase